jgi:hypothetical protein
MKAAISAALAFALLAASACQFQPAPRLDRAPYTGPEVIIDSWGTHHRVTLTAPTGGWSVGLDQTQEAGEVRQVFLTAIRPDPDMMVTQALQPHEIPTPVDSRAPIEAYIRVVEAGSDPADFPYRLAARSSQR